MIVNDFYSNSKHICTTLRTTYFPIAAFSLKLTCVFIQTCLQRSAPVWPAEAEGEGSGLIDGFITDYCGILKKC
jgi:hypothetical protein